jgi:hypothetical protein
VECRKNPGLADSCCDLVSVHVGSKVRTDTCEDDADPLVRQIVEQIAHGSRGAIVEPELRLTEGGHFAACHLNEMPAAKNLIARSTDGSAPRTAVIAVQTGNLQP